MVSTGKGKMLQQLKEGRDLMKGSLAETQRSCGKPGCRCQRGERHRGYFFSYRVKGKPGVIYIPEVLYPEVKNLVSNWKRLKDTVEDLTMMNVKLIQKRRLIKKR